MAHLSEARWAHVSPFIQWVTKSGKGRSVVAGGIEVIATNRRKRRKAQDGRPLRRWKIERLFAWLKNLRRLSSRWERYATILGMVQLGCALILLRHL
jgi:hypothetical protein